MSKSKASMNGSRASMNGSRASTNSFHSGMNGLYSSMNELGASTNGFSTSSMKFLHVEQEIYQGTKAPSFFCSDFVSLCLGVKSLFHFGSGSSGLGAYPKNS